MVISFMKFLPLHSAEQILETAAQLGGVAPLRRLLFLAHLRGATQAVVEESATCEEWQEELGVFLASVSDHLEGTALRVHLSSQPVQNDEQFVELEERTCVGHAILRPSPLGTIAHATVVPPFRSEHHFLPCLKLDDTQGADSVAFMQQDGTVTRCAHATIWMATASLSARFPGCLTLGSKAIYTKLRELSPNVPDIPSPGLTHHAMATVLGAYGYRVVAYDFESKRNARGEMPLADQFVYRYIESGIPVILGIDTQSARHAIVLIGHGFDADAWWPAAGPGYFPSLLGGHAWLPSASWTTDYIIHDDNLGPYLNISRGSIRTRATAAIIAIPSCLNMILLPEDAEATAAAVVFSILPQVYPTLSVRSPTLDDLYWWFQKKQLVLRTVVISRAELASHISDCSYDQASKCALLDSCKTNWVYLIEISSPILFGERRKYGELLLDPGVPATLSSSAPVLSAHFPGYVIHRDALGQFAQSETPEDRISPLFSRPSLSS